MHVLSKDGEGKDFASDALVSPGQSSTFEVTFTKTGTYDFQCDYHLPDMVGTITVE
jgi:plastocyanin